MLISNTLFRMGGAAVMLTNKSSEKVTASPSVSVFVLLTIAGEGALQVRTAAQYPHSPWK